MGPYAGRAAPRNTVSANSWRSTAIEMARRSSSRWSHAARRSEPNAPGRRLIQKASASYPTPRSYSRSFPASASRFTVAYASDGTSLIVTSLAPDVRRSSCGALLGDHLDRQPIEVRQLRALLVLPPVARVAREHHPLAGAVGAQHERAEAGDVRRRRGQAPRGGDRAAPERRLELVLRQHPQVVQDAQARRVGNRKRQDDGQRIGGGHRELFAGGLQRVGGERHRVRRLERKHHVAGRHRVAVRERDVRAKLSGCKRGRWRRASSFRPARARLRR